MIGDIIEIERARLGTVVPASGAPASNDAGKARSSAPSGNDPAPPRRGPGDVYRWLVSQASAVC